MVAVEAATLQVELVDRLAISSYDGAVLAAAVVAVLATVVLAVVLLSVAFFELAFAAFGAEVFSPLTVFRPVVFMGRSYRPTVLLPQKN